MLNVSELFGPVLQGEGFSMGIPSIFLRLAGCNLDCGDYLEASWSCDSKAIWTKSKPMTPSEICEYIENMGEWNNIKDGTTHLVITGGEPTLPHNLEPLKILIKLLYSAYIEIETNGTLITGDFLNKYINQVNCSPKLSNSGIPKIARINIAALKEISNHINSWFKFVISSEKDWEEIEQDFLPHINKDSILLMPAGYIREELIKNSSIVWNMACNYNVRATTRLQTITFDARTGV